MLNPKKEIEKMKKFILSLGLIAMAFGLTNCTKNEEVNPVVETKGDFAIYAPVTRTANDVLNTVWLAGDDLSVFHAVTDDTTYTKDGQFKLEDLETAQFLGNVNGTLDPQEEYDWYAMYPYSSYVPGPANTRSGYMTIGCEASATQTQTGNNSMAHVAGRNFPLVGKACAVPANQSPSLAMTNVATLLEFEVTNSLNEAITVSDIKFTAPSALVGTFYIDFTNIDAISADSSGDSYTSKTATLIVKNGEAIETGKSAKFYLPVAPFTAEASGTLAIEVNVTSGEKEGTFTKEITLAEQTSFVAGKIKNVKVNYNAELVEEVNPLALSYTLVKDVAELNAGDYIVIASSATDGNAKVLGHYNGGNNCPAGAATISGGFIAVNNAAILEVGKSGDYFTLYDAEKGYLYAASSSSNHLKAQPTVNDNAKWAISIASNYVATIKAQGSNTRNLLQYNSSSALFSCYASDSSSQASVYLYKGVYAGEIESQKLATPTFSESNMTINAKSITLAWVDDANAVKYVVTCGDTTKETDGNSITFTDLEPETEYTFYVTAIGDGVYYTDSDTASYTVSTVKEQSGEVAVGTSYSYTFESTQFSANGTKKLGTLNWELSGDGGYWGYDGTKGQQLGSSGKPYRSLTLKTTEYQGGVKTIKINTSGASSINATFTVTVGGEQIGNTTKLTTSATTYTLTSDKALAGDIVISYTQTSSKAIYIKSIAIN